MDYHCNSNNSSDPSKKFKGGAEKAREKKQLKLEIALKSCKKITDLFKTNNILQPNTITVCLIILFIIFIFM